MVDDALYVRGYNGTNSRWYQAAVRQRAGRIIAAGMTKEVAFRPVDGPNNHLPPDAIDDAYRVKYKGKPVSQADDRCSRPRCDCQDYAELGELHFPFRRRRCESSQCSDCFAAHDPVAVRRAQPEFSEAPWFVGWLGCSIAPLATNSLVKVINSLDVPVGEVGVISHFARRALVHALAEHHPESITGQEAPTLSVDRVLLNPRTSM